MTLLVVGTLAFDTVETPFGKRVDTLGGSANYLATAASYFTDVQMVGVVGDDFPEEHLDFYRSRKIDIAGVDRIAGKTFRWHGTYDTNLQDRTTIETQLNVLEEFDPVLPQQYRDTEFVVLGNIAPELQEKVLDQLNNPTLVAADTMDFWIEGSADALRQTIARVDLLSINDSEARQLSGKFNLVEAAKEIQAMGPRTVIIKRGEHGATLFSREGIFIAPAYPISTIKDPTGAGDSFAGGMLGYIARRGTVDDDILRQATIVGSTLASFSVEDFSLDRFRNLSDAEIQERFLAFEALTRFDAHGTTLWTDPGATPA